MEYNTGTTVSSMKLTLVNINQAQDHGSRK